MSSRMTDRFRLLVAHLVTLTTAARPLTTARIAPIAVATSSLTVRIISARMKAADGPHT